METDKSPYEVICDAIGEQAARTAIDALTAYADAVREGRANVRAMIVFEHPGAAHTANWGKLVTQLTMEPSHEY